MPADPYADMFRFPLGACVRWAEYPQTRFYVFQRRWTQREILDPVVEYRLQITKLGKESLGGHGWTHERDLIAWED